MVNYYFCVSTLLPGVFNSILYLYGVFYWQTLGDMLRDIPVNGTVELANFSTYSVIFYKAHRETTTSFVFVSVVVALY